MAISKERLKELIEQGATIYENKEGHILEISFDNEDIRLGYKVSGIYLTFGIQEPTIIAELENLFETEEDAHWELEFGNITRTETLKLPKFEQIISNKDDIETRVVGFYVDRIYYILEYASDLDGNWLICLEKDTIEDCECLFEAEPTKENYLKACKMAKKLFLGEGEEV